MILRIPLEVEKQRYSFSVNTGSFGKVVIKIHYNKFMELWVMGMEFVDKTPLFYGQTLIPNIDLLKPYRNKNVPVGKLKLFDNKEGGEFRYPNLENIKDFSLYYIED